MGYSPRLLASVVSLIVLIRLTNASRDGGLLRFSRSLQSTDNSSADSCASVAQKFKSWDPVSPSDFKLCLTLFPLNTTAARATIDTILSSLDNYVFENLAKNSPSPELSGSSDIRAAVKQISKRIPTDLPVAELVKPDEFASPFSTEYDFHHALHLAFRSLNDGHTGYDTACFHRYGNVISAFPLLSVVEDGVQKIKVAPNSPQMVGPKITHQAEKLLALSLSDYAGAEVVSIDGQDAVLSVREWSYKHQGKLRDQSGRFNAALARADFKFGSGSKSRADLVAGTFSERRELPETDTLTLVVKRSSTLFQETLKVPWLVSYEGSDFKDSRSYFWNQCQDQPEPQPPSGEAPGEAGNRGAGGNSEDQGWGGGAGGGGDALTPLFDSYVKAYILPSTSVGVLLVPDELLPDSRGERPSSLTHQFFLALQTLKMNGAEKLILDFQNNFGGDVVDGYSFLAILFPDHPLRQFPTQFRASKLIQQLVDAATKLGELKGGKINSNFYWDTWAEPNGVPYNDSSSFFYPLVSKQSGGVSEEYSKPFSVNPDLVSVESLFESAAEAGADGVRGGFGLDKEPFFSQENMLFVTNGLCVSACATVASYVEEMTNVTTVAVGGMMDLPMAIENTGGGQVERFEDLQQAISVFGLSESPYAPAPFDWLKTDFRFAIRQDLSLEAPHTPLEFLFKPAHQRVMYTDANVLNQHQLYLDVSALFG